MEPKQVQTIPIFSVSKNTSDISFVDSSVVVTILVLISKLLACGGFACLYIVAAEQFPSQIRSGAISILASAGKCTGMISPFIAYLVKINVLMTKFIQVYVFSF